MTRRGKASVLAVTGMLLLGAVLLVLRNGKGDQRGTPPTPTALNCDPKACPPTDCGPESHPVVASNSCCATCVPDTKQPEHTNPCARARCAPCPERMRPETVEGQCCPRCVSEDRNACEKGRNRYEDRFAELEPELRGCISDDDCTVASFGDACRANCPLPLNKKSLGAVVAELHQAATEYCSACAPEHFECPRLNVKTSQCVSGRCEFGVPQP